MNPEELFMRKSRLFALAFGVLLAVALVAQPANAQTNQNQNNEDDGGVHGFFIGGGMSMGLFNSGKLSLYSDFDLYRLNPAKIGAYYEIPLGIGNFFAGLEAGFASGSSFGGVGGISFLPINANATFAFNIANILFVGPGVKAGLLGILGHDNYSIMPLLGAGLDLEIRYRYFPLSVYGQGGVNLYPTANGLNMLPTVEFGIRFPRGAFRSGDARDEPAAQTGVQSGTQADTLAQPAVTTPPVTPPPAPAPVVPTVTSLTVNPASATVNQGATQQFTATVNGTNNPPQTVTWSLIGAAAGTSIDQNGLLTVGPNQPAGTLSVVATSTADPSRSATASVTVPAPASQLVPPGATTPPAAATVTGIVVNPVTSIVPQGFTQHFTAIVEGTNNPPQTVTWAVTGAAAGTSIDQNGLLTVGPNQPAATLTVRATSTANPSISGTSTVTVPAPAPAAAPTVTSVTVLPSIITVPQGSTQQFTATVAGTNNPTQTVTWAVTGGAAGTSISPAGLLTIGPNQPAGTLTVTATSTADPSRSGTSTVTVPAPAAAATPTVTNVAVTPGIVTIPQGTTQQFNAQVTGTNNPPQTVTWTVTGGAAGTSISPAGLLTVGPNQPAATLTVRATSTADTSRSGTATVTVPAPPAAAAPPAVTAPPTPQVIPPAGAGVTGSGRRDVTDVSKQSLFAEIHFEPDTAVLIESTRPQLDAAGRYLQANPGLWILVRTYTAPFGTAEGRFMVALDRARFCRDYLIQNYGISPSRILVETLASERLPENVVIEEWITYRTAELIMIAE